jgi:hypothetical protein
MHKRSRKGKRILYGTFNTFTQRPIKGRFRMRSIIFPIYMLIIVPQKISGCLLIKKGPGCTPWMINAPKSKAVIAFEGSPKTKSGIKAPELAALLDSVAHLRLRLEITGMLGVSFQA